MKTKDISAEFPGLFIIHQKIRGYEVGEHEHDQHEFFIPLQGEIQILVEGKKLKAGPGRMIYIPPHTPHSFQSDPSSQGERLILIIDKSAWKKHSHGRFEASLMISSQLCKEILFQLLLHPKTKALAALTATLLQILSEMLGEGEFAAEGDLSHLSAKAQDERIHKALAMIEDGFAGSLSATVIARQSGMSVRNLNRLFLNELHFTPKQVITLYRMESAKKILSKGKMSVTDVSFEVGYNSVSQFIATFRKITGQLPSSFIPLK